MKARNLIAAGITAALLPLGFYGAASGSEETPEDPASAVTADHLDVDEDGPDVPVEEDLARSDAVSEVAERIARLAENDETGFGTIHTDHDQGELTVFWAGEPPRALTDLAAERPQGIEISIERAAYSRAGLKAGSAAIYERGLSDKLGVMFVEQDVESGLTVGTSRKEPFTDSELDLLRRVSKIDAIRVEYDVPPVTGFSRMNDSAPWKGGGRLRLRTPGGVVHKCTTGFAVIKGGTGRLLSAGHCDPQTNDIYRDGAGQNIAPAGAAGYRPNIDSLLIDPAASPATTWRIFKGGPASNTKLTVKNYASNWPGDPVCMSGASLGTQCGKVYNDSVDITAFGHPVNVIYARGPAGQAMGGQGDSGAPIYKKVTGGAQARGILLGPVQTQPDGLCTGYLETTPVTITCSRFISYVPISTILNRWGATLEVG